MALARTEVRDGRSGELLYVQTFTGEIQDSSGRPVQSTVNGLVVPKQVVELTVSEMRVSHLGHVLGVLEPMLTGGCRILDLNNNQIAVVTGDEPIKLAGIFLAERARNPVERLDEQARLRLCTLLESGIVIVRNLDKELATFATAPPIQIQNQQAEPEQKWPPEPEYPESIQVQEPQSFTDKLFQLGFACLILWIIGVAIWNAISKTVLGIIHGVSLALGWLFAVIAHSLPGILVGLLAFALIAKYLLKFEASLPGPAVEGRPSTAVSKSNLNVQVMWTLGILLPISCLVPLLLGASKDVGIAAAVLAVATTILASSKAHTWIRRKSLDAQGSNSETSEAKSAHPSVRFLLNKPHFAAGIGLGLLTLVIVLAPTSNRAESVPVTARPIDVRTPDTSTHEPVGKPLVQSEKNSTQPVVDPQYKQEHRSSVPPPSPDSPDIRSIPANGAEFDFRLRREVIDGFAIWVPAGWSRAKQEINQGVRAYRFESENGLAFMTFFIEPAKSRPLDLTVANEESRFKGDPKYQYSRVEVIKDAPAYGRGVMWRFYLKKSDDPRMERQIVYRTVRNYDVALSTGYPTGSPVGTYRMMTFVAKTASEW